MKAIERSEVSSSVRLSITRLVTERQKVKYYPSSDLLSSLYSNKDYWDQTVDTGGWKYNFSWRPETTQNISIIPNMSGQWSVIVIVIPAAMLLLVKTLEQANTWVASVVVICVVDRVLLWGVLGVRRVVRQDQTWKSNILFQTIGWDKREEPTGEGGDGEEESDGEEREHLVLTVRPVDINWLGSCQVFSLALSALLTQTNQASQFSV